MAGVHRQAPYDLPGAVQLRVELARRNLRPPALPAMLGLPGASHRQVLHWLKGESRPSIAAGLALDAWSGGAVPAMSWLTVEEAAALARLTGRAVEELT